MSRWACQRAEQLPYVMGLIQQAFDHQLGSQADN